MLRGSIPPTGIPLPFVSAGGSSLMVFMAAMGVLCNIAKNNEYGERINNKLKTKKSNQKIKFT